MRTVPDVAYNAAIDGGIEVFDSPNIYLVGGTSAGSPQWAAIFALADQARAQEHRGPIGYANPALYALAQAGPGHHDGSADFHDITVGNNALDSPIGFSAGPGYDLASGLGTPNVANIVRDLTTVKPGGDPGLGGPAFPGHFPAQPPGGGHHHSANTMSPGA